ncbi:MAG TPA: hypothetical protein VFU15_13650 [Bacteroidia bacterium]|nr:hypothetical protein [Bacteroidia bacterium]
MKKDPAYGGIFFCLPVFQIVNAFLRAPYHNARIEKPWQIYRIAYDNGSSLRQGNDARYRGRKDSVKRRNENRRNCRAIFPGKKDQREHSKHPEQGTFAVQFFMIL